MATRDELMAVLRIPEIPLIEAAEKVGIPTQLAYTLLKQFEATFPDDYPERFLERIGAAKEEIDRRARVDVKRTQIRQLEMALMTDKHLNEETFLDNQIKELEAKLAKPKKAAVAAEGGSA